jgi:TonB family protein
MATHASGAAIAMYRGNDFVCCATTGESAPDLGAVLNATSGLSGACIQSAAVQRCDDSETDRRVDAAVSRQLGVRSILVVPLLAGEEVLGVFEVLSTLPFAFSDEDVHVLESLARRTVQALASPAERKPRTASRREEPVIPETPSFLLPPESPGWRTDYLTPVLTVAVVGVALLLGWMLGRDWSKARGSESVAASTQQQAESRALPNPSASNTTAKTEGGAVDRSARPATPRSVPPEGGLVVYEKGKVIFQMQPVVRDNDQAAGPRPVRLSPESARGYLLHRVEPVYPEPARQGHVQGVVVLQTLIGRNGTVQEIKALSGDPQLVVAAADAVRQWRFRPYAPGGNPTEFETQIPVQFALP